MVWVFALWDFDEDECRCPAMKQHELEYIICSNTKSDLSSPSCPPLSNDKHNCSEHVRL